MASATLNGAHPVGYLLFCTTRPGTMQKQKAIYPKDQFDVGREDIKELLEIERLTVSIHHVRLRCVMYDENDKDAVAPMIYFRVLSSNSVELKCTDVGHNTGVMVSRGHGDILLNGGDVLKLTPDVYLQFQYHRSIHIPNTLDHTQRAEAKSFADQFILSGRRLGAGAYASVYIAVKRSNKRQVACKAVPLPRTSAVDEDDSGRDVQRAAQKHAKQLQQERQKLAREYLILEQLDHPNITSLEKVICASRNIYIFQELITGGDLLSYLDREGSLAEPRAAVIVLQLLKAVAYLHDQGYAHRDIKPENVLVTSWRDGARVVLTDFGQARALKGTNATEEGSKLFRMQSYAGTPGYAAPELTDQQPEGYSKAIDVWSVGCVSATLLTGHPPFPDDQDEDKIGQNSSSEGSEHDRWDVNIIDDHRLWAYVSRKAKSFVKGCLAKDEGQRFTANQALLSGWLSNKHYAHDLAAAYERAIEDWTPRERNGPLIEFIDTKAAVLAAEAVRKAKSSTEDLKSKHFQTMQKPSAWTPSAAASSALTRPFKLQQPRLPPMSRDPKEANVGMPSSSRQTMNEYTFASPTKAPESFPFADSIASAGSAPLSIWERGPPQTQLTMQTLPLFRQYQGIQQTQDEVCPPTQTQLTLHPNPLNSDEGFRVMDSQESGRPKKKVCR